MVARDGPPRPLAGEPRFPLKACPVLAGAPNVPRDRDRDRDGARREPLPFSSRDVTAK